MILHETVIKGVMHIAPECIINSQGLMQPRPIAVTTAVINDRHSRTLPTFSVSHDVSPETVVRGSFGRFEEPLIDLDAMSGIRNEINGGAHLFVSIVVKILQKI